jgi:hypothetical protein
MTPEINAEHFSRMGDFTLPDLAVRYILKDHRDM